MENQERANANGPRKRKAPTHEWIANDTRALCARIAATESDASPHPGDVETLLSTARELGLRFHGGVAPNVLCSAVLERLARAEHKADEEEKEERCAPTVGIAITCAPQARWADGNDRQLLLFGRLPPEFAGPIVLAGASPLAVALTQRVAPPHVATAVRDALATCKERAASAGVPRGLMFLDTRPDCVCSLAGRALAERGRTAIEDETLQAAVQYVQNAWANSDAFREDNGKHIPVSRADRHGNDHPVRLEVDALPSLKAVFGGKLWPTVIEIYVDPPEHIDNAAKKFELKRVASEEALAPFYLDGRPSTGEDRVKIYYAARLPGAVQAAGLAARRSPLIGVAFDIWLRTSFGAIARTDLARMLSDAFTGWRDGIPISLPDGRVGTFRGNRELAVYVGGDGPSCEIFVPRALPEWPLWPECTGVLADWIFESVSHNLGVDLADPLYYSHHPLTGVVMPGSLYFPFVAAPNLGAR